MPDGISTIRDFYKVSQERDFARKNQFRVLSINSGAGLNVAFTPDDLVYFKGASLPHRTIQNDAIAFMGLDFNIPGTVKYNGSADYSVKFFADQKFQLWDKFTDWTRQIFDDADSTGNYFVPKASAVMNLLMLDNELNPVKKVNLIGLACLNVSNLTYEIGDDGKHQEFDVKFSFHFWTEETV